MNDPIVVKFISCDTLKEAIKKCMVLYGYGYEHIAELSCDDRETWVILSDDPIELDDTVLEMILDYYQSGGGVQYMLDANGKRLILGE